MTKALITPGTHPQIVKSIVINIDPNPLSSTASGGRIIASITRINDIILVLYV